MNRKEIKEEAKKKLQGNLWLLFKPFLIMILISIVLEGLGASIDLDSYVKNELTTGQSIIGFVGGIITTIIGIGYIKYVLDFSRGKNPQLKDLFYFFKKWYVVLAISILISIFTFLWTLLLIIPGIVAAISYSMAFFVFIDDENIDPPKAIKRSKELMNGYKADYFVFCLSFIGWGLLVAITAGIALIYVAPYTQVATCIYYDKLKQVK